MAYYCVRHTPEAKDLPDAPVDTFAGYPEAMSAEQPTAVRRTQGNNA
ncbi:MAG: hypothetical protein JW955_13580 [Sedimentisphaerales bacterium]|nr:hypothetical protein [Sedimentisphaerales bacterium]